MRAMVVVVLTGCSQIFGLEDPAQRDAAVPHDAAADATPDATPDADPRTCIEKWSDGPTFTQPELIMAVSTMDNDEWDPSVTADGLELYFNRDDDIHVVTRGSVTAPWGNAQPSGFNTAEGAETKVTISPDRLRAYVSSSRPGGKGGNDIWRYRRDLVTDPWVVQQAFLEKVNTTGSEHDPHLSADMRRLYLAVPVNTQSVAVASRADTTMDFSEPVVIAALDEPGLEGDPTLTEDERVIVYTRLPLNTTVRRLTYATRASVNDPFSAGIDLAQLNAGVGQGDSDPHISPDGCTLYFRSLRTGLGDIYVTTLQ